MRFIHALGDDLKALPSRDTALIGLVGTISAISLKPVDDDLADWVATQGESSYSQLFNVLGDGWVQGSAAIGAFAIGALTDHRRTQMIGADLVRGQILNGLVTRTLKVTVDRDRPTGGNHSFPSGHTSATFTSAAVLDQHFGWRVGVPAYAVAGLVGWSRLRDGEHWLTDTVAGATIGMIIGRAVSARTSAAWTVVPSASPGAVGFTVLLNPH